MGSEGPPITKIHVTGFRKFHGVAENPTETIVSRLKDYAEKQGLPDGAIPSSCNVLESAGEGAVKALYAILDSALPSTAGTGAEFPSDSGSGERLIWLHLGVNSGASKFAVECRALNEATFRCPDEMGWQPQKTPIFSEDGDISHAIEESARYLLGQHLNHRLSNRNPGASKSSKSPGDCTRPGPHQPFTWLDFLVSARLLFQPKKLCKP